VGLCSLSDLSTRRLNRLTSSVLYNVARFVRFFVAVWFIVGMVWVQASDDCPKELYHLCFVLIILFLIVAGLALINCCFYAGCLFASRTFRLAARFSLASPLSTDSLPRSGLSRRAIAKLPSKMFHPGSLPPEDAVCAICLAEYIPGEKIRSLGTCVHHFHATCIDQWLESKRNCPLCQTDVVKPKRSGSQPPLNVVPALPVSGANTGDIRRSIDRPRLSTDFPRVSTERHRSDRSGNSRSSSRTSSRRPSTDSTSTPRQSRDRRERREQRERERERERDRLETRMEPATLQSPPEESFTDDGPGVSALVLLGLIWRRWRWRWWAPMASS